MKIATATAILATVITATEGKKEDRTPNDWRSKDGDPHAAVWGSNGWESDGWGNQNDWGSNGWGDQNDWGTRSWGDDKGKGKSTGSWEGHSGKGKGQEPRTGKGSWGDSDCHYKTFYIDISSTLDSQRYSSGGITTTYDNYKAYKSSNMVGSALYDGVLSYQRSEVSKNSCQGTIMLGIDGVGPVYKNQIYVSTACNPEIDKADSAGYITDGGITGGLGYYASATGTMTYQVMNANAAKLKYWICVPYVVEQQWWGGSSSSWGEPSWDSWGEPSWGP